jgi:hypothetical protein
LELQPQALAVVVQQQQEKKKLPWCGGTKRQVTNERPGSLSETSEKEEGTTFQVSELADQQEERTRSFSPRDAFEERELVAVMSWASCVGGFRLIRYRSERPPGSSTPESDRVLLYTLPYFVLLFAHNLPTNCNGFIRDP